MFYPKKLVNFDERSPVSTHLIFWICVLLLDISANYFGDSDWTFGYSVIHALTLLLTQIPSTYFLAYFIVPLVFERRHYLLGGFIWLLSAYLLSVACRISVVYLAEPLIYRLTGEAVYDTQEPLREIASDLYKLFRVYFYHTLTIPVLFLALRFFKAQQYLQEKSLKLEKMNLESELKLLKAQLNPHFLFNTLNNIYSLSIQQSPHTSPSIARLAEMLDYILYGSSARFVQLDEEVLQMKNYLELEGLRYGNRLDLQVDINIKGSPKIIPLLLITLVENAFKHGISQQFGESTLKIMLAATENNINFEIANSLDQITTAEKGGIGLPNLQRQLRLVYGNQFELKTTNENGFFHVFLNLITISDEI